jgi:hypothetical protein
MGGRQRATLGRFAPMPTIISLGTPASARWSAVVISDVSVTGCREAVELPLALGMEQPFADGPNLTGACMFRVP